MSRSCNVYIPHIGFYSFASLHYTHLCVCGCLWSLLVRVFQVTCFHAGGGLVGRVRRTFLQTDMTPTQKRSPRPSELQSPKNRMLTAACCLAIWGAPWLASDTTQGWWEPSDTNPLTIPWNAGTCGHMKICVLTGESRWNGWLSARASKSLWS